MSAFCSFCHILFLYVVCTFSGSEDEPAPNQYNYNKGKDILTTKPPSYTIQQGRRGGAVFWMARGTKQLFVVFALVSLAD